jgi:hypothetical protein
MDLLSAVMHEMGHALGLGHDDHGVMQATLSAGVRLLPGGAAPAAALDGLFARWDDRDAAALVAALDPAGRR